MRRIADCCVKNAFWSVGRCVSAVAVDHYARLGLASDGDEGVAPTQADIKAAYRRKVLTCHPDLVAESEKRSAEAEFRRVSESYNVLMDEEKRRAYDQTLEQRPKSKGDTTASSSASSPRGWSAPPKPTRKNAEASSRGRDTRKPFLRRDADAAFAEAFDGRTVDEILFRERLQRKNGKVAESRTEPTPHAEVLHRVMDQAVKKFAEKAQQKYGRQAVSSAKIHMYRPAERAPAGSHIPFIPFHGAKIPQGVTTQEVPKMGPTSSVTEEPVVSVTERIPPRKPTQVDLELSNPMTRAATLNRLAKDHAMRANEGQLYSYHRPY